MNGISNRLWHTDASFESPAGRYSMLLGRNVPPVRADTQFADMRAAYEALDAQTQRVIDGLHVYHSIVYSRHTMGFDFSDEEIDFIWDNQGWLVDIFFKELKMYAADEGYVIEDIPEIPEEDILDILELFKQAHELELFI